MLRKALSDAERPEVVVRNAAAAARPPIPVRPESATWSSEQLREFLDFLKEDRLHTAFVLLATTGMRRGEVLRLRWQDVDFDGRDLVVANSLTTAGAREHRSTDLKRPFETGAACGLGRGVAARSRLASAYRAVRTQISCGWCNRLVSLCVVEV